MHIQSDLTWLLGLLALFLLLFRFYRRHIAPYTVFPTSWAVLKILQHFITGKIPKNSTTSSYVFGLALNDLKKYQSEGFCVLWIPNPYVLVLNEDAVKILSNEDTAINKAERYEVLEEFFGNGLLTSNGDLWRKRRKIFQAAFNVSILKEHMSVLNKHSTFLIQRLMKEAGEPVEILHHIKMISLDNLIASIFGIESDELHKYVDREKFTEAVDELLDGFAFRIYNPLLRNNFLMSFFSAGRAYKVRFRKAMSETKKVILKLVETIFKSQAERITSEKEENCEPLHKTYTNLLLQYHLKDPSSFTMDDVENEIRTLLIVGYDTVCYAIMWCLFLLGNYPEVQDRVFHEMEHLTGKEISYNDIQELTYMDCVIKETLRLYPPVPFYARRLEKDIQCGKYKLPEGTNVLFSPQMLHRNPDVFPNPEKFDPERFTQSTMKNAWCYTPFAEGARSCIGKRFALIEMKITLAHILQNFKVVSMKGVDEIQSGWEVVLVPSQPVQLRLTPRRNISQPS